MSNRLGCCCVDWLKCSSLVNTNYLSVQNMSIADTSFNLVCCSNGRVFTYSKVWRNQLNRLGNTFIHKNVPASKLRTNEICLVFLWMFSVATFSKKHVVFGISPEGEHGRHADHLHYHPISNKQATFPGDELVFAAIFAIFCQIWKIILRTRSVLHVMNMRYGHILHFSVYLNSYLIYWLWKLFLIAAVSLW